MQPAALAFFWHQHQPYYPDDVGGETLMPWVRLHGTKDYLGMALHIREVPEFRCTINLVPSLLLQLQAYTDRGRSDRHLDVSRTPADGLSENDLHYLLDNFFMANAEGMIRPHPRYFELFKKRDADHRTASEAASQFNTTDVRDLQVWNNLAWIHELVFEDDADLREFRNKGRDWSEDEKNWLLDKQLELLARVLPLHRELSEGGQVELTTTPFFHPILPLLWDKRSARQAMPGCDLPRHTESYAADAAVHLKRAVDYHRELFGSMPQGMWPSEGSVSEDILASVADVGIEWIATDEEILAASTNGWVSRDGQGRLRNPEMLYRPWRIAAGDRELQMVFRDHALSDLIGFHYQRSDPHDAAADLLGRVEAIRRAVDPNSGGRPAFVPVILDGENCWEYYPDGGVEFLRTLYRSCVDHPAVRPVTVSEHLSDHPAADHLHHLHAGSWISHNFAIWIGHHEDNAAWDLLHETRAHLKQATEAGTVHKDRLNRAWDELYIAEGSDWFWWFGDDHNSAQDGVFDELFRRHLHNVYHLLGDPSPTSLNRPITQVASRRMHTSPTAFLPVRVDGRVAFFEWISAGRHDASDERGTMAVATEGLFKAVYFGFDADYLYVRVDTTNRAADDLASLSELRIRFVEPSDVEVRITGFDGDALKPRLFHKNRVASRSGVTAAVDEVLEVAAGFKSLKLEPGAGIAFFVEAMTGRKSIDRAPREGAVELTTPSEDFERINWQA